MIRRSFHGFISVALIIGLSLAANTSTSVGASQQHGSWSDVLHQFDYQRQTVRVIEHSAERRGAAIVHDITYSAPGQTPVDAYLVTPTRHGRFAAAMFMHWLGPVNSDRSQFLGEAVALAGTGRGLVSLLPQLDFPFAYGPVGDVRDKDSVIKQVIQLRRGLDLLTTRHDVKDNRIAVIGHDYGGMYATLLGAVDRRRVHSEVVIAADATFGNWFVKFFLNLTPDAVAPYEAMLDSVDPIHYIAHGPIGGSLLQYGTHDFFIPNDIATEMAAAANPPSKFLTYDVDHELNLPDVMHDRDAFLARSLHV